MHGNFLVHNKSMCPALPNSILQLDNFLSRCFPVLSRCFPTEIEYGQVNGKFNDRSFQTATKFDYPAFSTTKNTQLFIKTRKGEVKSLVLDAR